VQEPNKNSEFYIACILDILSSIDNFPKNIIDVGANINASISLPFIKKHWDALLIEPQIYCVNGLVEQFRFYSKVEVVCCGCSNVDSVEKLFSAKEGEGSELATFSSTEDPWMLMVRDDNNYTNVQVNRLSSLIESRLAFHDVGILKIDTESFDYKVLLGLELDRHHPKIIVTEEYLWNIDDLISKHKLLENNGYICIGWSGYNTIWVCSKFFNLSWCEIYLWPWLQDVKRVRTPLNAISGLHSISELLNRTPYYDNCLNELDVSVSARIKTIISSEQRQIPVSVSNFGQKTIPSLPKVGEKDQLFISYHLIFNGQMFIWDGLRTPLPTDIRPREAAIIDMNIIAPNIPGEYRLEVDFVIEGKSWFSSIIGGPVYQCVFTVISSDN